MKIMGIHSVCNKTFFYIKSCNGDELSCKNHYGYRETIQDVLDLIKESGVNIIVVAQITNKPVPAYVKSINTILNMYANKNNIGFLTHYTRAERVASDEDSHSFFAQEAAYSFIEDTICISENLD